MAMINSPIGGSSLLPSYFVQNPDNNAMMPPGVFFDDGSMGPSPTDYAHSVTSQLGGTDVSTMGGPGSNVSTATNSGNTAAGTFNLPANYYSTGSFDPTKQLYPHGLINNQSSAQSQYGWIDPQQARAAGLAANAKQNATPPQGSTATADPSIFITPQGRVWVTGAGEGISAPDPLLESRLFPNGRPQGAPGPMTVPPPLSNTYSQTAGGGGQQTAPPPATAPPPPGGAGAGTPAGGGNSDFINQLYQMITGTPAGGYQPQQQRGFAPFQGYGGGYGQQTGGNRSGAQFFPNNSGPRLGPNGQNIYGGGGQQGGFGQQIGNPAFTGYGMQSPYQQAGNVYGQQFNVPRLGNTMQNPFSQGGGGFQGMPTMSQPNWGQGGIMAQLPTSYMPGGNAFSSAYGAALQPYGGSPQNNYGSQISNMIAQAFGQGGMGGGGSQNMGYGQFPTQGYGGYQGGYF